MVDHHGTLWIVKKDMLAQHEYKNYVGNREVLIKKGEILEWRYSSYNHFRTLDNKWFWVNDKIWNECCLQIGKINDDVRWKNKANTDDIWRLELFNWIQNGREVYQNIQKELEKESVGDFNPLNEESLISVKRESADSPNSPTSKLKIISNKIRSLRNETKNNRRLPGKGQGRHEEVQS